MVVSAIASTPQVAAFALPATCQPEGYLAAQRNGTLIQVAPQQTRTFTVTTGIE
ncbi:putative cytoplasmic domain protein [Escherichia coli 7-233-03_S3_C2]|nr:putative cytoplasmic domain protein [Escherichia coli 3-073-06_S4_C1]KEN18277.1 putative cytoplasmic domain protein [Escherichia coli 7-233-03_S3_C2]